MHFVPIDYTSNRKLGETSRRISIKISINRREAFAKIDEITTQSRQRRNLKTEADYC